MKKTYINAQSCHFAFLSYIAIKLSFICMCNIIVEYYRAPSVIKNSLNCLMLQKADTIEAEESVEPLKPEKKKTRKEKKGGASPEDEAGDGVRLHGERNGEQKATKKVGNTLM